MKNKTIGLLMISMLMGLLVSPIRIYAQKRQDADKLGMALEYFTSKKYHECMLLLQGLDKQYRLNPRYKAYLGVCYYYEWKYEEASLCLSEVIPKLEAFSPHERSFYHWACGESYFQQQKYKEAMPYYKAMLPICYDNEKPDAYYRLGFCYLFQDDWMNAWNNFQKAKETYRQYRNTEDVQARIKQVDHMLDGMLPKVIGTVVENVGNKGDRLSHVGVNEREGK